MLTTTAQALGAAYDALGIPQVLTRHHHSSALMRVPAYGPLNRCLPCKKLASWKSAFLSASKGDWQRRTEARTLPSAANVGVAPTKRDSDSATQHPATLTFLEGNSWLWDIGGVKILVDPVLVGPLDFGFPFLFQGFKRFHRDFKLDSLPELDVLLITQGFDDHCHKKTLGPLSEKLPNLLVIAPPSTASLLKTLKFKNVVYLKPGESHSLTGRSGKTVCVHATPGPILGPPWQTPENGYIVRPKEGGISVYYEPHCVPGRDIAKYGPVDVVVTPVVKLVVGGITFASGQEDAVKLVADLKAKYAVCMLNGELDATGLLNDLLKFEGDTESFKELMAKATGLENVEVMVPEPGLPLPIPAPTRT